MRAKTCCSCDANAEFDCELCGMPICDPHTIHVTSFKKGFSWSLSETEAEKKKVCPKCHKSRRRESIRILLMLLSFFAVVVLALIGHFLFVRK